MNVTETKTKLNPYALPRIRDYILNLRNNNYSKETLENYKRDLDIFSAFLAYLQTPFEKVDKLVISEYKGFLREQNYIPVLHKYYENFEIDDETVEKSRTDISEIKKAMYKGQLSDNSINRMLSALRSYLSFLVDIDHPNIPLSPVAIKMIKAEKKEKQVAEFNELVELIECPDKFEEDPIVRIRNRAILELIFSTGMRISEVVNLNRDQLKTDNGKIIDSRVYISGKGKKQRFVYLTDRAILHLEEYFKLRHDDYPAVFVPTKGTRKATENPYIVRLSQNYIQMKIADYRRRLGIIVPTSAHSLRHGFATYIAENGASPAAIQKLLGHSSLQTTSRYVHESDKFAEKTHRQFHPLQHEDDKSVVSSSNAATTAFSDLEQKNEPDIKPVSDNIQPQEIVKEK